jgi:RNA polymerase sigma-70 factor, ECF subfamily
VDHDVQSAIAALELDRRIVVVLHFILGFQLNEAAEILNIPPGTVASRLSRALEETSPNAGGQCQ